MTTSDVSPALPTPACKCCGARTSLIGHLDFNRSCLDRLGTRAFPPSELQLPYWSCGNCGFVFTDYMDSWSDEDFRREIYNADYAKADPLIPGRINVPVRETPAYQGGSQIASMLQGSQGGIRILDFGSGGDPGPTGLALAEQGFSVHSYDPYRGSSSRLPDSKYDVIIAIEVFEHCHNLGQLASFMKTHLSGEGILWIQTMLHPCPTPSDVLESWYIAPRNGHISIFTLWSLTLLFRGAGINIVQTAFATLGFKALPRFPNRVFVA